MYSGLLKVSKNKEVGNIFPMAADKLLQIFQIFQRFFQIDTIILDVWSSMFKLPKITSFLFLCNILP